MWTSILPRLLPSSLTVSIFVRTSLLPIQNFATFLKILTASQGKSSLLLVVLRQLTLEDHTSILIKMSDRRNNEEKMSSEAKPLYQLDNQSCKYTSLFLLISDFLS